MTVNEILEATKNIMFFQGHKPTEKTGEPLRYVNKITIWLNANKLMINVKKALHGLPTSKIKTFGTDVIMQNTSTQCVKSTQFLGVIIDNKLRWNDHITYVKIKFGNL